MSQKSKLKRWPKIFGSRKNSSGILKKPRSTSLGSETEADDSLLLNAPNESPSPISDLRCDKFELRIPRERDAMNDSQCGADLRSLSMDETQAQKMTPMLARLQAVEAMQELYGDTNHPDVLFSLKHLGNAHRRRGELQQAQLVDERVQAGVSKSSVAIEQWYG